MQYLVLTENYEVAEIKDLCLCAVHMSTQELREAEK